MLLSPSLLTSSHEAVPIYHAETNIIVRVIRLTHVGARVIKKEMNYCI